VNGYGYGNRLPTLGQDVMAAMNAAQQPPGGLELRDHFLAGHLMEDRSIVIYLQ
jgi:hypothetical protein